MSAEPVLFVPVAGIDNAPALNELIQSGVLWIQIAGDVLRLDTPVVLECQGKPASFIRIEPAPGVASVTVDVSHIGRNPDDISDPSFAGISYGGLRTPASFLTESVSADATFLVVADGSQYGVGDWINVSNNSVKPADFLWPLDGPGAKYQVLAVDGNNLVIDRPAERSAPVSATVSKCQPLFGAVLEGLSFTGDATVGIHIHDDIGGTYRNISSDSQWTGRVVLLIDNWNIGTTIEDSFAIGRTPGIGLFESAWGIAIEGGSGTRYIGSGASGFGTGVTVNYGHGVSGLDTLSFDNNINLAIITESLNSTDAGGTWGGAFVLQYLVTDDSSGSMVQDHADLAGPIVSLKVGQDGDDVLRGAYAGTQNDALFGGLGHDYLYGQAGQDRLYGESGDDALYGGTGDDILEGGTDADVLDGGAGDDWLSGGAGADRLTGGKGGSDVFFFEKDNAGSKDVITDFGIGDMLVTTVKIFDNNNDGVIALGKNKVLDLGNQSTVAITSETGKAVSTLFYNGDYVSDGVHYFVYSLAKGTGATAFAARLDLHDFG